MLNKILNSRLLDLFVIYLILQILLSVIFNNLILTDRLYFESYQNVLNDKQILKFLDIKDNFQFLSYLFLSIISFIRIFTVTIIIYLGIYLFNLKSSLISISKIVIFFDLLFVVPIVLKFLWFFFSNEKYTLEDVQFFSPGSILTLINNRTIESIWIYPLQLLNIFEVSYWILLAYGISKLINNDFDKALKIVLSSYLPALIIWVVFVMFLTVTLNP